MSAMAPPRRPIALMQTWAAVHGGYFDFMRATGDSTSPCRASAWLRRTTFYSSQPRLRRCRRPAPAISVLSGLTGDDATASAALLGDTAVEIIFDLRAA